MSVLKMKGKVSIVYKAFALNLNKNHYFVFDFVIYFILTERIGFVQNYSIKRALSTFVNGGKYEIKKI